MFRRVPDPHQLHTRFTWFGPRKVVLSTEISIEELFIFSIVVCIAYSYLLCVIIWMMSSNSALNSSCGGYPAFLGITNNISLRVYMILYLYNSVGMTDHPITVFGIHCQPLTCERRDNSIRTSWRLWNLHSVHIQELWSAYLWAGWLVVAVSCSLRWLHYYYNRALQLDYHCY